jgi:uncharacterized integral membrane protein
MTEPSNRSRSLLTPARVLWLVLALLALVLVLQNSADTSIQLLGWTVQAPLFMVLIGAMLIGWALGNVGIKAWSWRRGRERRESDA